MTIDEIKRKKREIGYTNEDMARLSNLPLSTVQKVLSGATKSPRYQTIESLGAVFDRHPSANMVRETSGSFAQWNVHETTGKKSVNDYYQLPEERRVELIDGVFYDMAAPSVNHQDIQMYLSAQLYNFINAHKGKCKVYCSPIDIQLDRNNWTMVQPDVIVNCDPTKNIGRCIYGAPDFVAEILSPSSKERDMVIKLAKYKLAGVKEYWAIDSENEKVWVYDFQHDQYPQVFSFDENVPVGIWEGELKISFRDYRQQ